MGPHHQTVMRRYRDNGESDLKAVQKLTSLQEQQLKFYESMMQTLLSP